MAENHLLRIRTEVRNNLLRDFRRLFRMAQPGVDHMFIFLLAADHPQIVTERSLNQILLIQPDTLAHLFAAEFHGDDADVHRMFQYCALYMMRLGSSLQEKCETDRLCLKLPLLFALRYKDHTIIVQSRGKLQEKRIGREIFVNI